MESVLLLSSPLIGALILGVVGDRRWAPELNVAVSLVTFLAACALTVRVVGEGNLVLAHEQFFVDPFNVFLVTLTALVGLTTALFSRPYMRIERDHGRVTAGRLRLYHGMYQLFMATMLTALTTNNLGLLWVAMEAATLSTVLLVTLYRTAASLEAGWKWPTWWRARPIRRSRHVTLLGSGRSSPPCTTRQRAGHYHPDSSATRWTRTV
jgi:hydrogenase-4 component F